MCNYLWGYLIGKTKTLKIRKTTNSINQKSVNQLYENHHQVCFGL